MIKFILSHYLNQFKTNTERVLPNYPIFFIANITVSSQIDQTFFLKGTIPCCIPLIGHSMVELIVSN